MYKNTSSNTGQSNVAIGNSALGQNSTGEQNIALKVNTLISNTIGNNNVGIGSASLFSNIVGSNNLAIGDYALHNNIASRNTAIGSESLSQNVSGTVNTSVGYLSLYHNVSGNRNAALGDGALFLNEDGSYNVAIGNNALSNNVSGDQNIGLGDGAGYDLNTENSHDNTFIGSNANTVSGTQINNSTAIGARAVVTTSNTIQLGDNYVELINTYGTVSATSYKGSGDELEITVNGVITSLVSKIMDLEDKILSLESGSSSTNSTLTFLERYDGTFWEDFETSSDYTTMDFIGIKNDPNGFFIENIYIEEENSGLQRLGDCYQISVGENTRYDSDGEREDIDVTIMRTPPKN